ncbi:hypothetical protein BDM02DRAFT_1903843 [Thelephora ganbajun]|uniref:Uncharacterized protein n=1 Tax=Thelephora ganbajun TaxID=370292 RepID=A0ACB6ZV63_THEGA|nr:hypothetical protein BDM02DRAFT_1903843 [Thelephora ganbajun]
MGTRKNDLEPWKGVGCFSIVVVMLFFFFDVATCAGGAGSFTLLEEQPGSWITKTPCKGILSRMARMCSSCMTVAPDSSTNAHLIPNYGPSLTLLLLFPSEFCRSAVTVMLGTQ